MALTVNLCDFISILFCILYHNSLIFNFLKWRVLIKRGFLEISRSLISTAIVLLFLVIMKIFVYDNCFLVGKHWWLQSFTMYVQLIVVIAYMCTRKVTGSRRSLLTLFHVNLFAI